ncbi:MAG: hypothetical protein JSS13_03125 [Proteobacteria bacterium]|nr:hypothetical protein [Pseudomonadota bacterium]
MNTRTIALAGLLAALPLTNAFATTWVVTGTGEPTSTICNPVTFDCPTLRDAFNSASNGDKIQFASSIDGGTILLGNYSNAQTGTEFGPSAFFITGGMAITIDGETGLTRGITIARDTAQAPFRLFDVDAGSGLTLIGLTLKNGLAQGFNSGSGGGSLGAGGAIFNQGDLIIDSCTFVGNKAQGGASGDGSGNYSGAGVGSAPVNGKGGGPNGSVVFGVPGGFGGGGIAYDGGSDGGFGGGGGSGGPGGNGGFGGGAGSASGGGSANGGFGGGGNNASSYGGGGAGMGGAIFNDAGTLNIVNSTFTANSASGGAGGNAAAGGSGFGGAIFNYSAVLTIQSSTLARNSVAAASGGIADGGALYSFDDRNCGVGGNTCPNGSASSFDLESSIFSNSSATHDVVVNTGSPPAVGTFSDLIVMSRDATQFTIANFASSADPQLSPLGNHGGWTPTMVPKQGSAAIDALTCTSGFARDDQRGVARPYPSSGQCDVGAVEYDGDYIFANGFDY